MGEVDQAFIQAGEHRPKLDTIETQGIPIPLIDLSTIDLKLLVSEIADACKNWVFFQVINHGVPLELFTKINTAAKTFFHLTIEQKTKVKRDAVNSYGYHESEHTKNVRDWKEVFDFLIKDPSFLPASPDPEDQEIRTLSNQWPQNLPQFSFNSYFEDHTSMIRFNHYPPCPCPELALGVGQHKDAGALTIIVQDDVGGLQVKRKSYGVWVPVKSTPNAFFVNVGYTVQVT
ncbi:2-oxoglutarate (2OG) and Fe(II)-dependent oxygenase superfamily protein [Hibiscus syriacus]|uniref:2-oxoglutarate (2OG) and Fe(II)-dependent oxygenase superfamily protein n=1 Tax=Hibiscus syriacus TaxID=106335 RepID=A0A6A2Y5D1_HIBSY|nr:2-oxoglutarate (2OG) and Fe(II)-dependent oxygenase superfamily protein [Hibiscus syriacus]